MKNKFRKAVFLVIYKIEKGKPKYIILKRKLHWIGWEFVKGGIERFETKRKAAKREGKEETGLDVFNIQKHNYKGSYIYPEIFRDRIGYFGQTFSLYSAETKPGKKKIILDPKEHSTSKWMTYSEAMKKMIHKEKKKSLKIVNEWLKSKLK
ncbi:NUDIX domain-containing protein [archaeon]|nr:NUDIX domain-containing protein [archaeon]PJC45363.1 MAG: hypothetical protein CO037_01830 [Candidatus Pacearchaeota archaeon CG_4_9_14_0_2_um_filter_30_8]